MLFNYCPYLTSKTSFFRSENTISIVCMLLLNFSILFVSDAVAVCQLYPLSQSAYGDGLFSQTNERTTRTNSFRERHTERTGSCTSNLPPIHRTFAHIDTPTNTTPLSSRTHGARTSFTDPRSCASLQASLSTAPPSREPHSPPKTLASSSHTTISSHPPCPPAPSAAPIELQC